MSTLTAGPVLAAATAPLVGNPGRVLPAKTKTDVPALPPGFPARLGDKLAWAGSDFSKTSEHILVLDPVHLDEIRAALESYKCKRFHRPPDVLDLPR